MPTIYFQGEKSNAKNRAIDALASRVRALEDAEHKKDRLSAAAKIQFKERLAAAQAREREMLADADASRATARELQLKLTASAEALNSAVSLERTARREVEDLKKTLRGSEEKLVASAAREAALGETLRQLELRVVRMSLGLGATCHCL